MKTKRILGGLLVLAVFLLLISCGSTANSGGGVGGSGIISRGAISEFGSIVVNGTAFDTTDAALVVNGEAVGTGDTIIAKYLDSGRVVTVQGLTGDSPDGAMAVRVIYRSDVKGPVSFVSPAGSETKQLTVMGKSVMVNYLTHFKNGGFDIIALDDVVDISGFYDDRGTLWATFLENTGETFDQGAIYEVKGFVSALASQQKTFMVNGIEVDYSTADTSGLPNGEPVDGLLVAVQGTVDTDVAHMSADMVVREDEIDAENAEEIEVAGFVTTYIAFDGFIVGNQVVVIEEGAIFVDGVQGDIAPGQKLEAEGELVDGILRAWEIEFWDPDQFEIEGLVIDFVSEFEFTVMGQVVNTTPDTVFEDGDPSDLDNGVHVEIKGRMADDVMIADKVSFELGDI